MIHSTSNARIHTVHRLCVHRNELAVGPSVGRLARRPKASQTSRGRADVNLLRRRDRGAAATRCRCNPIYVPRGRRQPPKSLEYYYVLSRHAMPSNFAYRTDGEKEVVPAISERHKIYDTLAVRCTAPRCVQCGLLLASRPVALSFGCGIRRLDDGDDDASE